MKPGILALLAMLLVPSGTFAQNNTNPKPVEVQGTVDVNVVGPDPLPVAVTGDVGIDSVPPVELAPDQQVNVPEVVFDPSDLVLVQSYILTDSASTKLVTIPRTMILRTITVVPSHIDTDPGLYNCGATVRWPSGGNPTDPASTDRIIVDHNWKGTNHISLNYAMPYKVRLVQGSQLETTVGRVGLSGTCEAIIILTGTKVAASRIP